MPKKEVGYTNGLMLQQLMWFNGRVYSSFRFLDLFIPDLFKTYYISKVHSSKSDLFEYLYDNQKAPNEINITSGKYTNNVYIDPLIDSNIIKAFIYFGYSANNFNEVLSFNDKSLQLNNNDILLLNKLIYNTNRTSINSEKEAFHNVYNIGGFKNYFIKNYSSNTLFYQLINFIILMKKCYDYFIASQTYIKTFSIQWEYSFNYNSSTGNITNNITLYSNDIINIYKQFIKFTTNTESNICDYTINSSGNNFYLKFCKLLVYVSQVYSDIYLEFLYNHLNIQGAPLYTETQSEKCYIKSDYMSESYYNKTKKYYQVYLENKKLVYPDTYTYDKIKIPKYFSIETLLNIYYITVNNFKNIKLTKDNLLENLDNITFNINTDLSEDDMVIFEDTFKNDFTNENNICWFITDFFIDNIKEYLENETIEFSNNFNIELESSDDDINLYILKNN